MNGIEIIGTGSYLPELIVSNDDLSKIMDTNDQWISSRTGIRERRISEGENTSDLAAKAAISAMEDANITAEEIDLMIVATTSPDYFVPSTACVVQSKIGVHNAVCFDISAACSGFIYAMEIARNFMQDGRYKKALIIGAEVLSKILDWKDRGTCVLFGDGAGAAVLSSSHREAIVDIKIASEGDKWSSLTCKTAFVENPYIEKEVLEKELEGNLKIGMNGKDIFKFAVTTIANSVTAALKNTGYSIEDIKYIVPHQANLRIIDFAAKKLGVDESKFYINLNKYGNTSGASVPIALDEMNKKGLLKKGDKIILVAFGGGLTWGYSLIQW
ncbi:beta-ketoacyl-ACP synthase III [Haloimpatiens lingqiaonensis]|uniref:beta-ketoacyl-ACP synthase III n=1 Tax=Haloimpatiens lingqiaonensis TaxID=1380675 RepID=UPI0010FD7CEF|nr:beta-ketoacyl-ACP synthase III [Haloimpatiens lingqiaonensis]